MRFNRKKRLRAKTAAATQNCRGARQVFTEAARLHQAGHLWDAVFQYQQVIRLNPGFADAWNNLGVAFAQQRRFDDAKAQFERALALNPEYADAHNNLGNLLAQAGSIDDAITHFLQACLLNPGLVGAHQSLGSAFEAQGRLDDAVRHYRHVLAARPDDAQIHNALATIFKFQGRLDDAAGHYRRAIAIRPSYAAAHYNRSEIKTFHPGDPDLVALELLAEKDRAPADEAVFIHFALAKALEDCEDFSRAFEYMRKGNDLKRSQIHYDEADVDRYFRRICSVFDRTLIDRLGGAGDPTSAPIFVVGMPRSGTTLVEQILSSHPEIHGAGELTDLEASLSSTLGADHAYPGCVPTLDRPILLQIAQAYNARLRAHVAGDVRVVDKTPANMFYLGLICLILPNARIIHIARDAVDTCLSCYSKLFTTGQQFTYDLGELGRFFRRYVKLMAHWRSVLPQGAILDINYEDLVHDLEGQSRRVIDYCGLPWDDRCLSFHSNNRPVRTASSVQVRTPLYRSSIERWRRFESGLAPLLHELHQT